MTQEDILKKHCPSMDDLFLDEQGMQFKARVLSAIQEAAAAERSRLLEEAGMPIPVNAFHATCPNCQTSVDVIPSNNTFIFKQSETFEPGTTYLFNQRRGG